MQTAELNPIITEYKKASDITVQFPDGKTKRTTYANYKRMTKDKRSDK